MQLHELTFAALGPFRERQHIDFSALASGGLFLLDGPTGAGKSTIIDAVVFALYGQVAGHHSSKHRLVSDHRDPADEPFVELVFETGRGVYRVRRTPEFQRPKKRGDGTVTQQASVKLWKASSPGGLDGDPLSTRAGEADEELRSTIGLSREQFVKTVVLPQGEFARFLQARSDERRDILQSIFGTEHYEKVQEELRRRRTEAKHQRTEADRHLRAVVESFADASGLDADGGHRAIELVDAVVSATDQAGDDAHAALTTWADEILAGIETEHHTSQARQTRAVTARADAESEFHSRQRHLERRDRLRAALAEKEQLEADRAEQEAREFRLDAARRAATCRTALQTLDELRERLAVAHHRVENLRATVDLTGVDVATAGQAEVAGAHRTLLDTLVGLSDILTVESALPDRRDELNTLHRDHRKLLATLADIETRCAALPGEIDALDTEIADARAASSGLNHLHTERGVVTELIGVHDALVSARDSREAADAAHRTALARLTTASEREADLRRGYLSGIAAELAGELIPGEPCQVCGSLEHPQPAARTDGYVAREQVEEAENERRVKERDRDERQKVLNDAAMKVAELEGKLDGRTADQLRARLADVDTEIAAAVEAADRAEHLSSQLVLLKQEHQRRTNEREQAAVDIASVEARIATLIEAIERDEARVGAELQGFPSVSARAADLERRAHAAGELAAALGESGRLEEDLARQHAQLHDALTAAGFESPEEATATLLPTAEVERLDQQVREWARRLSEVEGRINEPELAGVDPHAEIDVQSARSALDACSAELDEAQRASAAIGERLERSRRASSRVAEAITARRHTHRESAAVIRLAGLANADSADNALRMPLATYVLQRVFDGVVDAANARLVEMSSGRYSLEAFDGRQARSLRTGLGLQVIDAHTGHSRDTSTLSGGETFYVSLSLALGLADVVTAQAGGMQMGTLFIDEGFGSLDSDTLDAVMGVLAGLRSGGRVVGVVSHVDELKTRIPERIEVRRPRPGAPSTLTVTA